MDSFDEWFAEFKRLAEKSGCAWIVSDKESYRGNFDEGVSPEETLALEISYAD